jgi:hypothetical protein
MFGEETDDEFLCCVSGKRASVTLPPQTCPRHTQSGRYWCTVGVSFDQMLSSGLNGISKTGFTFYEYATVVSLESGQRHRVTMLARMDDSRVLCAPGGESFSTRLQGTLSWLQTLHNRPPFQVT